MNKNKKNNYPVSVMLLLGSLSVNANAFDYAMKPIKTLWDMDKLAGKVKTLTLENSRKTIKEYAKDGLSAKLTEYSMIDDIETVEVVTETKYDPKTRTLTEVSNHLTTPKYKSVGKGKFSKKGCQLTYTNMMSFTDAKYETSGQYVQPPAKIKSKCGKYGREVSMMYAKSGELTSTVTTTYKITDQGLETTSNTADKSGNSSFEYVSVKDLKGFEISSTAFGNTLNRSYEYDKQGNWIKQSIRDCHTCPMEHKRTIEYW